MSNLLLPRCIQSDFGKRPNNEVAIFQRTKASKPSCWPGNFLWQGTLFWRGGVRLIRLVRNFVVGWSGKHWLTCQLGICQRKIL